MTTSSAEQYLQFCEISKCLTFDAGKHLPRSALIFDGGAGKAHSRSLPSQLLVCSFCQWHVGAAIVSLSLRFVLVLYSHLRGIVPYTLYLEICVVFRILAHLFILSRTLTFANKLANMLRSRDSTQTPPSTLRRRYQNREDKARHNGSMSSANGSSSDAHGELELSIHHPPQALGIVLTDWQYLWCHLHCVGNRFEVLKDQAHRTKSYHEPPSRRISRRNRGPKEGKRRRDVKRSRRQQAAAQILDQRLAMAIDDSLGRPHNWSCSTSEASTATATISSTSYAASHPTPSTPPHPPDLNFGPAKLIDEFPCLTPEKQSLPSTPVKLPAAPWTLPARCPSSTSCSKDNNRWSDYPLFFDLSSLPEPVHRQTAPAECQKMQLWRPKISPQPKKQSKFFPSPSRQKLNVKLPPIACKLHETDQGIADNPTTQPRSHIDINERATPLHISPSLDKRDELTVAHAANLWQILATPGRGPENSATNPYVETWVCRPKQTIFAAPRGSFDYKLETVGTPVELGSREIPFVHDNSLTGHSNERATFPLLPDDSAIVLTPITELLTGLNELFNEQDEQPERRCPLSTAVELSTLPPSPCLESTVPVFKINRLATCTDADDEENLSTSDAHFQSEQDLFHLPSPMFKAIEEDLIDVATFLKMGHAPNCWCLDCSEAPELVHGDALTEDEGWMVYHSAGHTVSSSDCSTWKDEWGTFVESEDLEVVSSQSGASVQWGDDLACKSGVVPQGCW